MRLAIVSDIHGNLTALEAVVDDISRRGIDQVVHGGDLALIWWQPAEVVDRVRELGWPGIVGNTDELLWRPEQHEAQLRTAPKLKGLLQLLFDEYAPASLEMLGDERLAWLRQLPAKRRERDLLLLHASPGDLWRAPPPDAEDPTLTSTYGPCRAKTVVYGHIHRPYVRHLDRLTVANSGSVGSQFDGDPRASYLLVDSGQPHVIRVEYDVDREIDRGSRLICGIPVASGHRVDVAPRREAAGGDDCQEARLPCRSGIRRRVADRPAASAQQGAPRVPCAPCKLAKARLCIGALAGPAGRAKEGRGDPDGDARRRAKQDRVALLLDPAGRRSLIRPFRSSQATRLPWTSSSSGRPWMPRGYRSLPTAGSVVGPVADFSERVLVSRF